MRACRSGQTGQTQDLLAYAYGGSNPPALIYGFKETISERMIPMLELYEGLRKITK